MHGRRPPPPPAASVRKLPVGALSGDDAVTRLLALAQSKKEEEGRSPASAWANVQVVSADYDELLEEEAEAAALAAERVGPWPAGGERQGEGQGEGEDMNMLAEDEHRQTVCEEV